MTPDKHLNSLRTHWKANKSFPSMAKLADVLGLASSGGVFKVLGRLVDQGYLERVDGRIAPTKKFFALPVLGTVRAGLPQPESQDTGDEVVGVEDFLVRHPDRTVFCRAKGDSMRDAGILNNDMLVVERNTPTKEGDIVVAVVDNELTVKRLFSDVKHGGWQLQPANPEFTVIRATSSLEVLGVVVGVFRRFDR
ncbi:S24 family peptidase [Hydrogenophaga sp.]|uniref:LexA family protein n=1 Tax=Hydrogenophaga sp. TaxID=1904254 RepID=UPI002626380E|nr:S24 family peptidase [Hydrogenophaga sp.]